MLELMGGKSIPPLPGLPFSARLEIETEGHRPDGSPVRHKTYRIVARDSSGRTHDEIRDWTDDPTPGLPELLVVALYDPSTKNMTILDPQSKTGSQWKLDMECLIGSGMCNSFGTAGTSKEEALGTMTMEGLSVRGVRTSPPVNFVTESWYSDDLKLTLLRRTTDPLGGETRRITHLVRQEPEASLFAIPDGYRLGKDGDFPSLDGVEVQPTQPLSAATVTPPTCISCPQPEYTSEARAANFQGSVSVKLVVTPDGRAVNPTIVNPLGMGLEKNIVEAIKKWQFKPALGPNGKSVPVMINVEVTFKLVK